MSNGWLKASLVIASAMGVHGCAKPLAQDEPETVHVGTWSFEAATDILTGEPTFRATRSGAINGGQADLLIECPQFSSTDQVRLNTAVTLLDSGGMPMEIEGIDVASNTVPMLLNLKSSAVGGDFVHADVPVVAANSVRFALVVVGGGESFGGVWTVFLPKKAILSAEQLDFEIFANGNPQRIDLAPRDQKFREFVQRCSSGLAANDAALQKSAEILEVQPELPIEAVAALPQRAPSQAPQAKPTDVTAAIMATAKLPVNFPAVSAPSITPPAKPNAGGSAFKPYAPAMNGKPATTPAPGAINPVSAAVATSSAAPAQEPTPVVPHGGAEPAPAAAAPANP